MALTFNWKLIQSFIGEMTASFLFGFAVYSIIIGSKIANLGPSTPACVALTVAFTSISIIYAFSDITLAHFNPAITFSAIVFRKIPVIRGLIYIVFQCLGFMIACAVVLGCFPIDVNDALDTIRPKKAAEDVTRGNMLCTEMFLTGILTFIAFQVAINSYKKPKYIPSPEEALVGGGSMNAYQDDAKPDKSIVAPLVIGLTLGFLAFLGISSSGGVFNPGLVWAPVLLSGDWFDSWVYWVAEFVGGVVGAGIQVLILARIY